MVAAIPLADTILAYAFSSDPIGSSAASGPDFRAAAGRLVPVPRSLEAKRVPRRADVDDGVDGQPPREYAVVRDAAHEKYDPCLNGAEAPSILRLSMPICSTRRCIGSRSALRHGCRLALAAASGWHQKRDHQWLH